MKNVGSRQALAGKDQTAAKTMENGLTRQSVAEHYGYSTVANKLGCWKIETGALDRLAFLPEVLDPKKKFRVTFDYDPEFPRALLQISED